MRAKFSPDPEANKTAGLKGYRLFRVFGFEVKLNLSWLLFALLITWTLAGGLFPVDYPGLSQQTYWWMAVAGAIGILMSIVLHELSHSIVARHFGLPIRGITLFIFGGVAEMEDEPGSPKVEFLMAIVGPVMSLFLAFLFFHLEQLALHLNWLTAVVGVIHYLAIMNMIVAVFNLIPAFPLDGGRMFRAVLWYWMNDLYRATRIASQIGAGLGLVLIILGVFAFFQGNFIGGMWWVLIGAFMRGAANLSYQQLVIRGMLGEKTVREFMNTKPITVSPNTTITALLEDYIYQYYFKMFPVVDNDQLLGCVLMKSLKKIPREDWPHTRVYDLLSPCSAENTVSPDASVSSLITSMTQPDANTRFMVVEDGRLVGMVSMKNLTEFIALRLELESAKN